jgi:hypothetical protein
MKHLGYACDTSIYGCLSVKKFVALRRRECIPFLQSFRQTDLILVCLHHPNPPHRTTKRAHVSAAKPRFGTSGYLCIAYTAAASRCNPRKRHNGFSVFNVSCCTRGGRICGSMYVRRRGDRRVEGSCKASGSSEVGWRGYIQIQVKRTFAHVQTHDYCFLLLAHPLCLRSILQSSNLRC